MTTRAIQRFARGLPFLLAWSAARLVYGVLLALDAALKALGRALAFVLAGAAFIAAAVYAFVGCADVLFGLVGQLAPHGAGLAAVLWRGTPFFGVALGLAAVGTGIAMLPAWLEQPARPKRRPLLRVEDRPRFYAREDEAFAERIALPRRQ